jgi:hypothetical protein
MARFAVGVLFGIVVGSTLGAALSLHADDVQAEVQEAAAVAHVDATDLQGAVNSVGVDPYTYLRSTGELPPLPREPAKPPRLTVWDRLVQCEASGNWHNARNLIYKGGLQFDAPTWARYGGLAFAWRADFATREQQIVVAERTLAAQGFGAWPSCSLQLGLR